MTVPTILQSIQQETSSDNVARVMICDDSAVIREALTRMLETDPAIKVVARTGNGKAAIAEQRRQPIDVIVMDIEMPVMDGLTAVPLLLHADPTVRIIIASTLTSRGAEVALRALRLGASDYVPKPSTATLQDDSFRLELIAKIRGLARLRRRATLTTAANHATAVQASKPQHTPGLRAAARLKPALLAIGSSTGGPQALFTLIQGLGRSIKIPVVLTQHMPATFIPILAHHLTKLGGMLCTEAQEGEILEAGRIYLAPGDRHFLIEGQPGRLLARLTTDSPENFCRPAVDPMLRSASHSTGGRVLVVILTGMGHDGLAGTKAVIDAGGTAIAQDEATSVVWGMPGAISRAGLCHAILPMPCIAAKVRELLAARFL